MIPLLAVLVLFLQPYDAYGTDPGIEYSREVGLVAQPGWQATDNDYTVTVAEAYVDINRFVFTFSVDTPETALNTVITLRSNLSAGTVEHESIDQYRLPLVTNLGDPVLETHTFYNSDDASEVIPIDLNVTVLRNSSPVAMVTFNEEMVAQGGIEVTPLATTTDIDSGFELRLESLRLAPSAVFFVLCYDAPAEDTIYWPESARVETTLTNTFQRVRPPRLDFGAGVPLCVTHYGLIPYEDGEVIITILELSAVGEARFTVDNVLGTWLWIIDPTDFPAPQDLTPAEPPFGTVAPPTPAPPSDEGPVPVG